LGVEDGDITKLDGASGHGKIASHESIAADVGVAADADPSTHGEGTGRGRPRLLWVEDSDITKLDGASGHRKVAPHESVSADVGVTADPDASGHCQRAGRGRPRLLGVEDRDVAKLDGASGHRKVSSHESVAGDVGVAPDANASGHRESTGRGRPRLLRVEDRDVAKLDRASGHGKIASDKRVAGNVGITSDADASGHDEGTCRGRPRLLRVENSTSTNLDSVSDNVDVATDADPSGHCECARGG